MDEEQKTINEGEQNTLPDQSTEEPKTPEVKTEEVQTEKTDKSTDTGETEGKKVTGAEKRIHKLVDERDQAKAKAQDLEAKLAELTAGVQTPAGDYSTQQPSQGESSGGERELTVEDLRTIARLEVEKERTVNRINREASEAQRLYPELDKESENFDPDVNEAVTTAVWHEIKNNPSLSVKKLTEKYMKPYRKAAERAVGQEQANLTKQVNDAALRPSNVKVVDKKFEEKSIKEMEADLGFVY